MAIRKSSNSGIPFGNTAGRPASPTIGQTYYNGTLEILEIYNGTTWVAVSAPPATPSIATPTDASTADAYTSTAGKLSVVFTPGSGGGTPNQYNAYTTAGGYSGFNSTSAVVISGLTPGTPYTVYGNAQNNFGTTVYTANAAAVTPTTLPQTPTIGTATAAGAANEIAVTWTLGNNGGKNLSAITITPYLNGTTAETPRTAATTSSTSYTFTEGQLTASSAYTFKVKTTNANGTSAESSATNSATMPNSVGLQYAIISGGGGGGGGESNPAGDGAGGGGAGGFITNTIAVARGSYSIEIGGGGAGQNGAPSLYTFASNGNLSRIHQNSSTVYSLSTVGGGGGGGNDGAGQNGACGGGASGDTGTFGTGSVGFNGGTAGAGRSGGGGGGMSAAGSSQGGGGNGGAGVTDPILSIGVCGGGAGGRGGNNTQVGVGSTSFGGGNHGTSGAGSTGGGGGGGMSGPNAGGSGGSGRIILKTLQQSSATTGSPSVTTSGSHYIYDFTSSGSITWN